MIWLTKEQIISIHSELITATGGLDGVRDDGMLESAIASPFQTFNSIELFPSVVSKAVRLACGLTQNHPFIDGNKRIGAHSMLLVLALNNVAIEYTQKELIDVFLSLASGSINYDQFYSWVTAHIVKNE